MKLTNTHKHFGLMLLLGILAWAFAFLGKAQGLGIIGQGYIGENNRGGNGGDGSGLSGGGGGKGSQGGSGLCIIRYKYK